MSIVLYGTPVCTKCDEVKKYLTSQGVPFTYLEVGSDILKEELELVVSRVVRSVPVITFTNSEVTFEELKQKIQEIKEREEVSLADLRI